MAERKMTWDELAEENAQLRELVDSLSGRDVEAAVTLQVKSFVQAVNERNIEGAIRNLLEGLSSALVIAVGNGRWAALENRRADELLGLLHEAEGALVWASGSGDFGPSGQAEQGWDKIARPVVEKIRALGRKENSTRD